jgi:hypothetical protein
MKPTDSEACEGSSVLPPSKPAIVGEEEKRFKTHQANLNQDERNLGMKSLELQKQKHDHDMDSLKNKSGIKLIYSCILIVIVFAIADVAFKIDSDIFNAAFEVIKLMLASVLGYVFASKGK